MPRRRNTGGGAGGPRLFGVTTARDYYDLLLEDFDDFMEEPHSARRAIHCAVTAYHLHDWVWGERLAHDPAFRVALGCETKSQFVAWLCRMMWCFELVQEIATGSKHFRPSPGQENVRVQAPPAMFDTLGAGWDQGAWDEPIRYTVAAGPFGPKGQGYLLIDLGPGAVGHEYQPAAHVLEAVVRLWRDFFRKYDAGGGPVPCSVHHVD